MKRKLMAIFAIVFVLAVVGALCACESDKPLTPPSNIQYDGAQITWDEVDKAVSYSLSINDGAAQTVTTNSFTYDAKDADFKVTLVAVSKKGEEYNSSAATVNFKHLGTVQNLRANENGMLVWDEVEGATAYVVSVNNAVAATVAVNQYDGLAVGTSAVRVRAIKAEDPSYYSSWSASKTFDKLASPENLRYVKDKDLIKWDNVPGAASYLLRIDEEEFTIQGGSATSYEYHPGEGTFNISVCALAPTGQVSSSARITLSSDFSEVIDYTFLPAVEDIEAKDGALVWSFIQDAAYQVEVTEGNQVKGVYSVDSARYSDLKAGTQYTVRVRALPRSERDFSTWSLPFTVYFLTAPTIHFAAQNDDDQIGLTFTPAAGESGRISAYKLYITRPDGKQETFDVPNTNSFNSYSFDEMAGEYKVSVQAIPRTLQGTYECSSALSAPISVVRLDAVSGARLSETDNAATVTFNAVSGASGYRYWIEDADGTASSAQFPISIDNAGATKTVSVQIKALGSDGNLQNGKYYLGSATAYQFDVTKLATVTGLSARGSILNWNMVGSAAGYEIMLNDSAFNVGATASSYSYSVSNPGEYTLKVRAKGDTADFILSGEYSTVLTGYKLHAPEITNISDAGILSWNINPQSLTNSKVHGISLAIGNDTYSKDALNEIDITEYVQSSNVQSVALRAVGDGAAILDSEPSVSVEVMKLNTPQNLGVVNAEKNIVWNEVSNASTYRLRYVYTKDGSGATQTLQKASFGIGDMKAEEFTVYVRAMGYANSVRSRYYISSDEVSAVFTKLASPVIDREGTDYVWDAVSKATGYTVRMANVDPIVVTAAKFTPAFSAVVGGEGTELTFVANGNDAARLIDSDEVSIRQVIKKAVKPSLAVTRDGEDYVLTATHDWNGDGAMYVFEIDGTVHAAQADNVFRATVTEAGEHTFRVYVRAGFFRGNVYYLDSDSSDMQERSIRRPVKDVTHDLNAADVSAALNWTNPENAAVSVTAVTGDGTSVVVRSQSLTSCVIDLRDVEAGAQIIVTIVVKGNKSTVDDSAPVVYEFVNTLQTA